MSTPESPRRPNRRLRREEKPASPEPSTAEVRSAARSAPAAAFVPTPREPTDFEGLQAIADLDRGAVRAAMDAAMGASHHGSFKPGQRVSGRVSTVGQQAVFVDIGGKSDAILERLEVGAISVGDRVDAFVHSTDGGEIRLTRTPSGSAAREMLQEAMAAKLEMEGKVAAVADSGWQVTLAEGIRGFCPASHTGVQDVSDGEHVGKSYRFHVQDLRGSDVVLTRRAIVEAEASAADAERLGAVREGEVFAGTVVSLREFGAFVKLSNGVEGLVHISNLSETRPKHPSEIVKEGDAVQVRVLAIDKARRRIDLGIRQAVDLSASRPGAPQPARGFNVFAGLLNDVKVRK